MLPSIYLKCSKAKELKPAILNFLCILPVYFLREIKYTTSQAEHVAHFVFYYYGISTHGNIYNFFKKNERTSISPPLSSEVIHTSCCYVISFVILTKPGDVKVNEHAVDCIPPPRLCNAKLMKFCVFQLHQLIDSSSQ